MVVFDMAGTTVKDKGNVASSFQEAFLEQGIEVSTEAVKKVMGWRKIDAIGKLLESYRPGEITRRPLFAASIHENFTKKMVTFYQNSTELAPLPFATELFSELREKNIKVCLNTGFTTVISQTILDRLEWRKGEMIDDHIASDEVEEGRPHPYMIIELMKRQGISDAASVVKVGDTEVDILEGREAHCGKVIAITTGAYTRNQLTLYQPDAIIDVLSELPSLIL